MINLAGREDCDITIKKELDEAGIEYIEFDMFAKKSEVPSRMRGAFCGWQFRRAWYYWVASAFDGVLLPMDVAEKLHKTHGKDVRVAGHCCAPAPREWYKELWHIGVPLYHIDTQAGLNAFAGLIRELATEEDTC